MGWMYVSRDSQGDWCARCKVCDDNLWAGHWTDAMAWSIGHLGFYHPRIERTFEVPC